MWVEGELGAIPGEEDRSVSARPEALFTDPAQAAQFVERTGADALAVQIGNVHGFSADGGRLDLVLLTDIAAVVPVPLVLHGASGLEDGVLRAAIHSGVAKINVNAELRRARFGALDETPAPCPGGRLPPAARTERGVGLRRGVSRCRRCLHRGVSTCPATPGHARS
ncbi:class II fructose-bisphosphate aldolase [Streptomyces sp. NPDC051104]|uniref:class II fructose-bisphosphate aldolase n=1 Tax=Streptomyces sp. NPDC051104 TaxID=3155044 RepID=UPI003446BC63